MADKDPSLTNLVDYIAGGDGSPRAWTDKSLTVDLGGLEPELLASARIALDYWSDVAGFEFTDVSSGADIRFGDGGAGAYTSLEWTDAGEIVSAFVNVDDSWMNGFPDADRWDVGDYGLQTFVHEIGHALGLQHPGLYNGTGSYEDDAIFAKDTWKWSIMSYFDQSSDGSQKGYFISSPGVADVAAIEKLYGPLNLRTGDDIYTIDRLLEMKGAGTYTLVDSGGEDTFDLRASDGGFIDLRGGGLFTLGDNPNDFGLSLSTTIENALGSDGGDRFIGNDADNLLVGYGDGDALYGGDGDDTLIGGAGTKIGKHDFGDYMEGGAGEDLFVFASAKHMGGDVIAGFKTGADTIGLTKIDADVTRKGDQAFDFIGRDDFSGEAGELRFQYVKKSAFLSGDLDGDGEKDFSLQFKNKVDFHADDFLL